MRTHHNKLRARMICFGLALSLSAICAADPAGLLFRNVIDNANLCAYGKDVAVRTDCYIAAAPEKCEPEARKFLATQNRELFYCVSSCVNAGMASRAFGECSRSLDRDDAGSRLVAIRRDAEERKLAFYWSRADKANSEALLSYPYLGSPSTSLDWKAIDSFEFLKKQYLTVSADPYSAVHRAANETNAWYVRASASAEKKAAEEAQRSAEFHRSTPITSEIADVILGRVPVNTPPDCVIKQTMTNADYRACGINPPGQ